MIRRLIVRAALTPVMVPLAVLDWLQPIDEEAQGWPSLVILPEWFPGGMDK